VLQLEEQGCPVTNVPDGLGKRLDAELATRWRLADDQIPKFLREVVRIAHGVWVVGDDFGEVHHVSRNKLEPTMYFNEAEAIAAKADLARALHREFRAVRKNQN
jgi:hypothetical protein